MCKLRYQNCLREDLKPLQAIAHGERLVQDLCRHVNNSAAYAQAHLNSQRNCLAPINALSEAVLHRIFWFATQLGTGKKPGTSIINISRTCSYWRTITFKSPDLWSTLELSSLSHVQSAYLASHSQDLPLSVILCNYTEAEWAQYGDRLVEEYTMRLQVVQLLLPRTKILQLDILGAVGFPSWLLLQEVPLLRHMKLSFHAHEGYASKSVSLPQLFATGNLHQLQTLVLHHIFVQWSTLARATSLTTLHLHFPDRPLSSFAAHAHIDRDLLRALQLLSQLRVLSLSCSDRLRGCLPLPSNTLINLYLLQTLRLHLVSVDVGMVLSSIITSKELRILEVVCRLDRSSADELIVKLPTNPDCLPSFSDIRGLDVDISRQIISGSLKMVPNGGLFPIILCVVSRADRVDNDFDHQLRVHSIIATWRLLQNHHPMPLLSQLTITDTVQRRLAPEDFILFLKSSPALTELTVHGCRPVIVDLLAQYQPPACPKLSYVYFSDMTIQLPSLLWFYGTFLRKMEPLSFVAMRPKGLPHTSEGAYVYLTNEVDGRLRELWLDKSVEVESEDGTHVVELAGEQWKEG